MLPARAASRAMASPMPELQPVTSTTLAIVVRVLRPRPRGGSPRDRSGLLAGVAEERARREAPLLDRLDLGRGERLEAGGELQGQGEEGLVPGGDGGRHGVFESVVQALRRVRWRVERLVPALIVSLRLLFRSRALRHRL